MTRTKSHQQTESVDTECSLTRLLPSISRSQTCSTVPDDASSGKPGDKARFPKRKRRGNHREPCLRPLPRLFGSAGMGFNRGSQVRITAGQSEQKDILHRGWAAVKAANWPNYGQMSKYFANKGEFSPEARFVPCQKRGGRRSTPGIQALEISTTACITCSSIDSRVLNPVSVSRPIASSICSDNWPARSKS